MPRNLYINCIRKGELDHMESPEVDEKEREKVNTSIDSLFARIPLPADPMKAALAKTDDEIADMVDLDALKEAMRDRYHRRNQTKRQEARRLDDAMIHVSKGTHRTQRSEPLVEERLPSRSEAADAREAELRAEIEAMRAKVALLEAQLKQQ